MILNNKRKFKMTDHSGTKREELNAERAEANIRGSDAQKRGAFPSRMRTRSHFSPLQSKRTLVLIHLLLLLAWTNLQSKARSHTRQSCQILRPCGRFPLELLIQLIWKSYVNCNGGKAIFILYNSFCHKCLKNHSYQNWQSLDFIKTFL